MGIDALSAGGSRCRTHAAAAVLGVGSLPAPPRSLPPQRSCARSSCKLQCLEQRVVEAHGSCRRDASPTVVRSRWRRTAASRGRLPPTAARRLLFPQPPPLRRLQIARPPIIAAFSRLHTNVACRGIYDHGGKMHVSQLTMQLVRMYPGLTSHSLALAQSSQLLCVLLHAVEAAARAVS